jgi:hypothetical protein
MKWTEKTKMQMMILVVVEDLQIVEEDEGGDEVFSWSQGNGDFS